MNRSITPDNVRESQKLKAIWSSRKTELGVTQDHLVQMLGVTQGFISQCLNGHVALSTDIIFQFAEILQFNPQLVRDDIFRRLPVMWETPLSVRFSTSGESPKVRTIMYRGTDESKGKLFAVSIDSDSLGPRARKGDTLIVSEGDPKKGDEVLVRFLSGAYALGIVLKSLKDSLTLEGASDVIQRSNIDWVGVVQAIQK